MLCTGRLLLLLLLCSSCCCHPLRAKVSDMGLQGIVTVGRVNNTVCD